MKRMIFHIVSIRILRIALAMAVIVNYQISGKPHQPVCQIAVFGIVLVERFVNADKNILRQIFGGFDARRKTIGKIKDAP
jgi:hypothetical protein